MSTLTLALRCEMVRVATVRTTWIVLVATIAGSLVITQAAISLTGIGNAAVYFAAVLLSIPAAQALGQEDQFRTLPRTLTWFPRRWDLMVAKTLTVLGLVAVASALWILVAVLAGRQGAVTGGVGGLGTIVFLLGYAVIAMAVAGLTRNVFAGVLLPALAVLGAEGLAVLGVDFGPVQGPMTAASAALDGQTAGVLGVLAWAILAWLSAMWAFQRRSA